MFKHYRLITAGFYKRCITENSEESNQDNVRDTPKIKTIEEFVLEMQKSALRFGMTMEQFWHGNPQLYFVYHDSYLETEKDKMQLKDNLNWILGQYITLGTSEVLSYPHKKCYPEKPFLAEKSHTNSIKEKFIASVERINATIRKRKEKENG